MLERLTDIHSKKFPSLFSPPSRPGAPPSDKNIDRMQKLLLTKSHLSDAIANLSIKRGSGEGKTQLFESLPRQVQHPMILIQAKDLDLSNNSVPESLNENAKLFYNRVVLTNTNCVRILSQVSTCSLLHL
jgi:hypothetical protein